MPPSVVLLLPTEIPDEVALFEAHFREYLAVNHPATCLSALRLQEAACEGGVRSEALCISLLDISPGTSMEGYIFNWSEADFNAFHSLQSVVKTIVWVTRGANMMPTTPRLSPIIGLARTLMSEDLQKTFATFDLSQKSLLSEPKILDMLVTICGSVADTALSGDARDVDFAEKDGALHIPRLETLVDLNHIIEKGGSLDQVVEKSFRTEENETGRQVILESSLHLDVSPSGPVSHFKEVELGELSPGEIAISFESAILVGGNEGAVGQRVRKWHSYDVTGYVSATGAGTNRYQIGDKVISLIPRGNGLRSTMRVGAALVMDHRPGFVPSQFLSAYYALFDAGKVRQGKKILVHAGASGFGLAAVELALLSGATVFATVMGPNTDKQRAVLQERGIEHDHIFDGNNDSYPSIVKLLTKDQGVDLVYNPTHKDVQLSVACVRRCKLK